MSFKNAILATIKAEPTLISGVIVALNAIWVLIFPETVAAIIVGVEGALLAIVLRALVLTATKAKQAVQDAAATAASETAKMLDGATAGAAGEIGENAVATVAQVASATAQDVLASSGIAKKHT